jgi:hypothetical protein
VWNRGNRVEFHGKVVILKKNNFLKFLNDLPDSFNPSQNAII